MIADSEFTPQPQEVEVARAPRRFTIGIPAVPAVADARFPLTPEAVAMLVDSGYTVKVQEGAGNIIHYTDRQYLSAGADLVSREDAWGADIVLYLMMPECAEVRLMRRRATLITLQADEKINGAVLRELMRMNILTLAVDRVADSRGNAPFHDILAEIDGRAAVIRSVSMMADPENGKGILPGGVAGVVPCEYTVIGSGIAACAAAMSAIGLGATVRMLDNDVYTLRHAVERVGSALITSVLHPRVLSNALRSADVVIVTDMSSPCVIDAEVASVMKKGVIVIDLCCRPGNTVPSANCLHGVGGAVRRTAAMALGNAFITLLHDVMECDGALNCVKMRRGIQEAVITYMGKVVNERVARMVGMRAIDIRILLNCC